MEYWLSNKCSTHLCHILGIEVRVHHLLWLMLGLIALGGAWTRWGAMSRPDMTASLILVVGTLGSVFFHELAHAFAARIAGKTVCKIVLLPFGGATQMSDSACSPWQELVVAAGGPVGNFALGGMVLLIGGPMWTDLARLSVALAVLNCLPLYPLDGGRILRVLLAIRGISADEANVEALKWSRIWAVVLAIGALFTGNPLLVLILITLWIMAHQQLGNIIPPKPIAATGRFVAAMGKLVQRWIKRIAAILLVVLPLSFGAMAWDDPVAPLLHPGQVSTISTEAIQSSQPDIEALIKESEENLAALSSQQQGEILAVFTNLQLRLNLIQSAVAQATNISAASCGVVQQRLDSLTNAAADLEHHRNLMSRRLGRTEGRLVGALDHWAQEIESCQNLCSILLALGVALLALHAVGQMRLRTTLMDLLPHSVPSSPSRRILSEPISKEGGTLMICASATEAAMNPKTSRHSQCLREDIPDPNTELRQIIAEALGNPHIFAKPELPTSTSFIALATATGHIRSHNEDYGMCFTIAQKQVLILADGCGGLPFGSRASYLAACAAARTIVRLVGTSEEPSCLNMVKVCRHAMLKAGACLHEETSPINSSLVTGLRTTLIVVIADEKEFSFAYIGDGGGMVIHKDGSVERFLVPQRNPECASNVLTASLGPTMEGEAIAGIVVRKPGDLMVCGTDGVFDFVDAEFTTDVWRSVNDFQGDLQRLADTVVQELAETRDSHGWICSDNLTLGLIGDDVSGLAPAGVPSTTASVMNALEECPEG